jgi:hypothetical protein
MWEDLRFRSVSPLFCVVAIICAIFQGGVPVLFLSVLFACLFMPAVYKQMVGMIDGILLSVYSGLLADLTTIGYFFLLAGGFGLLWTCFKKTSIPLVTMMGASYSLIISMQ